MLPVVTATDTGIIVPPTYYTIMNLMTNHSNALVITEVKFSESSGAVCNIKMNVSHGSQGVKGRKLNAEIVF